ncbi:hypothetical protein KCU93_g193, partial [Aureobasidium melanogenum]
MVLVAEPPAGTGVPLGVEGAGSGGSVEGSTNTGGGLLTEVDAVTEGGVDSTLGDSDGAVADGEDGTEVSGTALDQEVANESTVELGAEGRLSKSGESSHARGRGGLGSVGRRAGVLAGRGNGSRHADVLVLGDGGGHTGSEGHGGDDVADGRHFCCFLTLWGGNLPSTYSIACACNGAVASARAISSLPGSSTVTWLILQR